MIKDLTENSDVRSELLDETRNIVINMLNTSKPIISAVNGVAVGAGLQDNFHR